VDDWSVVPQLECLCQRLMICCPKHNPPRIRLYFRFEAFLATIETPQFDYDIGGGTENYTEIAARAFPRERRYA